MRALLRTALLTDLVVSALATAGFIAFRRQHAGDSAGDSVQLVLFWFPSACLALAPLCFVVFPLVRAILTRAGVAHRMAALALTGGALGFAVGGYVAWRFREQLLQASFVAAPLLVGFGFAVAALAGFIYDLLARRSDAVDIGRGAVR